ncbi:MAG: hypothetical protein ACE5IO_05840 [Thermoplasmata archaeon]
MMRRGLLITFISIILLLTSLSLFQPSARAETILDLDVTVPQDEYHYWALNVSAGDTIRVVFESDHNVDLFFVNKEGFEDYEMAVNRGQGVFEYYIQGSAMDTNSTNFSFTVPEVQDFYYIVDNTFMPDNGAEHSGPVSYSIKITKESFDVPLFWTICSVMTGLVMGLVLAIVYLIVYRKKVGVLAATERPPVSQQPSVVEVALCPDCRAYSSRGDFCTQCGRKLR